MPNPTSTAKRLVSAERRQRAVEMRKAGVKLATIARELGVSHQAVSKMVAKELDAIAKVTESHATRLRTLELERLDALLLGLWEKARRGHEGAVDRVLRVMERRAKLLGLDMPTKHEIGTQQDAGPIMVTAMLDPRCKPTS